MFRELAAQMISSLTTRLSPERLFRVFATTLTRPPRGCSLSPDYSGFGSPGETRGDGLQMLSAWGGACFSSSTSNANQVPKFTLFFCVPV